MTINNNGIVPEVDAEESLIDLANRLVETADQLLKAAYVLATLTEKEIPPGSMLKALLDAQKAVTLGTSYGTVITSQVSNTTASPFPLTVQVTSLSKTGHSSTKWSRL
jgi:hypothetical protein